MSEVMRAYGMYCGASLSPKEVSWLTAKGVHPDVLGWGNSSAAGCPKQFSIRAASVRWEGEWWFDFAVDGRRAAIIVCLDERGQPADLAAWSPSEDKIGLHLGNVAMIGQEQIAMPRLEDDKLWVHASPLEWLVHRRSGIVILNYEAARPVLCAASPLAVKTATYKAWLEEKWCAPRIQVFEVGVADAISEAV